MQFLHNDARLSMIVNTTRHRYFSTATTPDLSLLLKIQFNIEKPGVEEYIVVQTFLDFDLWWSMCLK